jgi:hypothetical protein
MSQEGTPKGDRSARLTERVPWIVTEVSVISDRVLAVRFVDGTQGTVDVSDLVFGDHPGVFEVLRDPLIFRQVGIEDGAVTWPGELDLAPDAMYDAIRATGHWMA